MKLNKFFGLAVATLMLCFTACNNERGVEAPEKGDVTTYVGLSVRFASPTQTEPRAGSGDYNKIEGTWGGRDKIETMKVFVVTDKVDKTSFTKESFSAIDADGYLNPRLAVEATAGQNAKVYVIINDVNNVFSALDNATDASTFEENFKKAVTVASLDEAAKYDNGKDIIIMTNEITPTEMPIEDGVSKEDAIAGIKNRAEVTVARVASRGIVTIADNVEKTIEVERTTTSEGGKTQKTTVSTITIGEVSYKLTGSSLAFNPIEDRDTWKVPNDIYDFYTTDSKTWEQYKIAAKGKFTYEDASDWKIVSSIADNTADLIKGVAEKEEFSKFVLPVTHDAAGTPNKYQKGNTPMFEVKVKFTVDKVDADEASEEGQTLYYGVIDGLFYSTKEKAQMQDPDFDGTVKEGEAKQEVKEYNGSTMYYYIWVNPKGGYGKDLITDAPVYRNKVYNAHITGFGEMGVTGKEEVPPTPPLEEKKSHLSVRIKVLDYTMHSYKLELGNRY